VPYLATLQAVTHCGPYPLQHPISGHWWPDLTEPNPRHFQQAGALRMTAQLTEELELITDKDVAELMKVPVRTVRRLAKRPDFPRPLQIGRIRRWDKKAVCDFCRGAERRDG
jgi:predicted DNA-binding transcriptional regulator AlpA